MTQKEIPFEMLSESDLFVDGLYKGGVEGNLRAEVFSKLIPGCSNSGGFRIVYSKADRSKVAYVVLFTTLNEIEWPDYLDKETGVFRYYGDNRHPGRDLLDTPKGGNRLLRRVFDELNLKNYQQIPPFLLFKKGKGRDMQFLGLAAPGVVTLSPDRELVAFWRTLDDMRFQNYEAYFTVLDTGEKPIARSWLYARYAGLPEADKKAPAVWRRFVHMGRRGLKPLKARVIDVYPDWFSQVQSNSEGMAALAEIRRHYGDAKAYDFEGCATEILLMSDPHFTDFQLTRPWRDGGRDAVGYYQIQVPGQLNSSLRIDCALEAKCYTPTATGGNGVGVHEMSRLISRIRYRQFGAMVTTSFITKQAFEEVKEDGHPILLVTANNIATVLQQHGINSVDDVESWLREVDTKYQRM